MFWSIITVVLIVILAAMLYRQDMIINKKKRMMDYEMLLKLKALLIKHEGYKTKAYVDTTGNITIGIGHNLTANDVSSDIITRWFYEDVGYIVTKLSDTFSWFANLNEARKIAIIDMAFNLGFKKFCEFERMLSAIELNNFKVASEEILNSVYAHQVGERANELATIIFTGSLP